LLVAYFFNDYFDNLDSLGLSIRFSIIPDVSGTDESATELLNLLFYLDGLGVGSFLRVFYFLVSCFSFGACFFILKVSMSLPL